MEGAATAYLGLILALVAICLGAAAIITRARGLNVHSRASGGELTEPGHDAMIPLSGRLRRLLTNLPRQAKRAVIIAADLLLIPVALWAAFLLRLAEPWPEVLAANAWLLLALPLLTLPILHMVGLYRSVVRFMGARAVAAVAKGAALSTMVYLALTVLFRIEGIPRSTYFLYFLLALVGLGGARYLAREFLSSETGVSRTGERVLIYGAGAAGAQLVKMLHLTQQYRPIAFIDDDKNLHGTEIQGIPVYSPERIDELVDRKRIAEILLAMPSATRRRRRDIVNAVEHLPVHVRTVPGLDDIIAGDASVDQLREIEIDDLLARDQVVPDAGLLDSCIAGQSVLVTGAGGSIGTELCRQIAQRGPRRIVLFEQNEFALYRIERELTATAAHGHPDTEIIPLLGTVTDQERLERTMKEYGIHTVYHAAAYKHVPLVEANVTAGVWNNIFGTLRTVRAAVAAGVENFVLISTDKAVNPIGVMGASKRVAEQIVQAYATDGQNSPAFSIVRFGNVLDSAGSVIPVFRESIRQGGPVTVTHPEITRYFMTIPEASQLVIQAGALCRGGDIFVLDMGEPVRIIDLAHRMIRLSGLTVRDEHNPDGDIAIEFTGLRPGEKLYEELLIGDNVSKTRHPLIQRAHESFMDWTELDRHLGTLRVLCHEFDDDAIRRELARLVDGYEPNETPEQTAPEQTPSDDENTTAISLRA